jgi:glutathione synthase
MRQDPPFDFEYVTATWLLERAMQAGARIFNHPVDPRPLREARHHRVPAVHPAHPRGPPPADINAFIDAHGDTILKPLDGMGGSQIFRVRADDPNRNVIIETLTQDETRTIMAQAYLPAISGGDKRVLIIGGQVIPTRWRASRWPARPAATWPPAARRGCRPDGERAIAEHLAPSCGRAACSSSAST